MIQGERQNIFYIGTIKGYSHLVMICAHASEEHKDKSIDPISAPAGNADPGTTEQNGANSKNAAAGVPAADQAGMRAYIVVAVCVVILAAATYAFFVQQQFTPAA